MAISNVHFSFFGFFFGGGEWEVFIIWSFYCCEHQRIEQHEHLSFLLTLRWANSRDELAGTKQMGMTFEECSFNLNNHTKNRKWLFATLSFIAPL